MQIKLPRYALDMLEATDFTVADLKISMKDGKFFCSMTLKDINQSVPAGTDWASIDPGLTHVISMITSSGKAVKWQNSPFKHLERSISEIQSLRDKKKAWINTSCKISQEISKDVS